MYDIRNLYSIRNSRALEGYSVWRLLAEDQGNESNWDRLSEFESDKSFTDNKWDEMPAGVYRYAVRAVFTNNNLSSPAFSNVVSRGMHFNVTINIETTDERSPVGTVVRLFSAGGGAEGEDLEYTATLTSGNSVSFTEVFFANYSLTATLAGYNTYTNPVFVVNNHTNVTITLIETAWPARRVVATESGNNMVLTWAQPHTTEGYWWGHQVGRMVDGVGLQGPALLSKGHRYTPAQLTAFGLADADLTRVSFAVFNTGNVGEITIEIYTGGTWTHPRNPGTLRHSQDVPTHTLDHGINEVVLTEAVTITATEELWIVIRFITIGGAP